MESLHIVNMMTLKGVSELGLWSQMRFMLNPFRSLIMSSDSLPVSKCVAKVTVVEEHIIVQILMVEVLLHPAKAQQHSLQVVIPRQHHYGGTHLHRQAEPASMTRVDVPMDLPFLGCEGSFCQSRPSSTVNAATIVKPPVPG